MTVVMTGLVWRLNPGGIFHKQSGTDWQVVMATASSWFLPALVLLAILAFTVAAWLSRRR